MEHSIEKVFTDQSIEIDGAHFERCKFNNCVLVYSGGDLPTLIENQFVKTSWAFAGAAKRTLDLLQGLYEAGGTELVDNIFASIKYPGGQANAS